MSGRIVTVFGASGFLGRHTVRALAKAGWRIRAACRYPQLAEFLRTAGMVGQVQPFHADVTNAAEVRTALRGADAVVNLVGTMQGGLTGKRFDAINAGGAGIVARAAAEAGVGQLVHVGALGARAESASHYARSKAAGEQAVRDAFPGATVIRPSILFGPEDAFFNRLANLVRYVPVVPMIGADSRFQPAFVGDVAAAILACLERRDDDGAAFELGGPGVYTMRQLMELVIATVMRRRLLLPVPSFAARLAAYPMLLVPGAPITPDQVTLLGEDNVVTPGTDGFGALGIHPESVEAILPTYLWRFRRTGQFETAAHT
ncbi:MAG: complex I NDUFA9 subunit family protein [Alphaproteobacteria bacterium]|nr:complex I NDUFA9 subunit family protein [Alphaproteobacteria bacterium]